MKGEEIKEKFNNWFLDNYGTDFKSRHEELSEDDVVGFVRALNIDFVRERLLYDLNVEYKHETGTVTGKLKYDDSDEYLVIDYDGGTIHDPYIEKITVL